MIVRSFGFALEAGNAAVPLTDLFGELAKSSGIQDNSKGTPRRIYVDLADAAFVRGLVVTIKDVKAFCELVDAGGKLLVSVSQLKGKNKLMEFNFFLINKANGRGIYQYYHQSCSPGTFASYLRSRYRSLCDMRCKVDIAKLGTAPAQSAIKAVNKKYYRGLFYQMLVRKESLESVLSKFAKIKSFEYEYAQIQSDRFTGVPVGPYVKKLRERVSFKPSLDVSTLAKAIQSTIGVLHISKGHVGVTENVGNEEVPLSVKLADIPENFGEQDYDVVSGKMNNLDLAKFASHKILDELQYACTQKFKSEFLTKQKP